MSQNLLKPGDLVAERYRIESLIGSGGHAHVYLANQEKLGRQVALKVLKGTIPPAGQVAAHKHQVLMRRFEQEARLISQLRDPHTITMFDYGNTTDGLLYMVCEYVQGESMKEMLIREGKLEAKRVASILEQLLMSLQEAHAYGVLHRDIKPDNIMLYTHLGRRDQVKLLDFGIAKIAEGDDEDNDMTAEGALVGTPRYIAPERIRGEPLRPASDLYSLGLVAYEALTGRRVLDGLHGVRALQAQLGDPSLKIPDEFGVPNALRALVERMIEKDLELRYQVAEQVIHELQQIQHGQLFAQSDSEAKVEQKELNARIEHTSQREYTRPSPAKRASVKPDPTAQSDISGVRHIDSRRTAPATRSSLAQKPVKKRAKKRHVKGQPSPFMMFAVIAGLIIAIIFAIAVLCYLIFVH